MTELSPIALKGVPGSPYTRKMLALLRYRRLPYRLILASHEAPGLPMPKVSLLPTFFFPGPDGELQAVTDSSPILRRLDAEHPARRVRPEDPALAFLDSLLEDYADEWLTKAMFHYRWRYEPDIKRASDVLPAWRGRASDAALAEAGKAIAARQIPRLRYVGSNEVTGPVIEASYMRFLDAFEAHLRDHAFLLGARPGGGDFGAFGQLTQLAMFDPTPMAITAARAQRVFAWVGAVEDLSGLEPAPSDWFSPSALPASLKAILAEVGRVYAPLLIANAKAVQAGAERVETEIGGQPWIQQPFPYQAKCLAWLREEYAALNSGQRASVAATLADAGCEALIAA
ncbi:MAG TPA: glutathione S-transferase N-terminal domain-containing protein [Phenylobacterium sp.]|jgi:glutathione S-transferase|uniref:glutathione S-transferase N-terminal domain-containing protein n=1 Tax=Phenylobacterium sp. TaxID=1871053 RepID=UPI002CF09CFD|nr:glutathione S-transferase N-terminal domain-containing protein [Phenylobacterium sp.]HXA39626.1 glutathione S-transferase N-terminal domain-containing protein [Phenylobacterium sp.]